MALFSIDGGPEGELPVSLSWTRYTQRLDRHQVLFISRLPMSIPYPIHTSMHKTGFIKLEIWGKDLPFQPRALKRTGKECWGAMPAALHRSSNLRTVDKILVS